MQLVMIDNMGITERGQNSTGAIWYFCPGCSAGTEAIFPLLLWSRRLWWRP